MLIALLFVFSGCSSSSSETSTGGGGGVVGGGGGGGGALPPSTLAGTYTGTATATASALGLSESETVPVTVIIDQNGGVTIKSDSDIFPNVVTLNGNAFNQSQTFNNQDFGSVTCSGTLNLQGSINGGTLNGILSSQSVSCLFNGANIPGTVTGTITAIKQG